MSVIANNVLQKSNITGTGAYSLETPPVGFDSFVSRHGDGAEVFYTAQREDGQKKEFGRGVVTAGTPDTMSRTVISSSNNDQAIDWQTADQPIFVYTSPPGSFLDDVYHGRLGYLIGGGSANAITVSPAPKWTAYTAGNSVRVKIAATNTSETVNIDVSTLGNKAVKMPDGTDPPVGALVADSVVEFVYEAVADVMIAVAGDVVGHVGTTNTYKAPQRGAIKDEGAVSGATTLDFGARNDFKMAPSADFSLPNPNNVAAGQKGTIHIDNSGGHALTSLGANFERLGGTGAPTLATGFVRLDYHAVTASRIEYVYLEAE